MIDDNPKHETEHPGAQENYDMFVNIFSELIQLEKDVKSMDEKLKVLFGGERKRYNLKPCYKKIGRIFRTVDEDAMGAIKADGLYLMTQQERWNLFG